MTANQQKHTTDEVRSMVELACSAVQSSNEQFTKCLNCSVKVMNLIDENERLKELVRESELSQTILRRVNEG